MKLNAVRAWKDEAYRLSLSEKELTLLPESPVGELELTDADLEAVQGGGCGHSDHGSHGSHGSHDHGHGSGCGCGRWSSRSADHVGRMFIARLFTGNCGRWRVVQSLTLMAIVPVQ